MNNNAFDALNFGLEQLFKNAFLHIISQPIVIFAVGALVLGRCVYLYIHGQSYEFFASVGGSIFIIMLLTAVLR